MGILLGMGPRPGEGKRGARGVYPSQSFPEVGEEGNCIAAAAAAAAAPESSVELEWQKVVVRSVCSAGCRVVQKVSARLRGLATMLGESSRNLADTFLDNPILRT